MPVSFCIVCKVRSLSGMVKLINCPSLVDYMCYFVGYTAAGKNSSPP